jgi:hypothetical protein
MAKKTGNDPQKKQAKREAKAMLAVEQARADLEKAEKKMAKAHLRVEASATHLRNLEAALNALRGSPVEASAPDSGYDWQQGQPEQSEEMTASSPSEAASSNGAQQAPTEIPVNQVEAQPPVEGRTDISAPESEQSGEEQPAEATEAAAATGDITGESETEETSS